MTHSKLAAFLAALALISIASHSANAAPVHRGHFIQGDYTKAFDSGYRDPTTREALDEGAW